MQANERWISGELTLEDMLADPIVRLLMAHDGLTEDAVRSACEQAVRRLRSGGRDLTEAA